MFGNSRQGSKGGGDLEKWNLMISGSIGGGGGGGGGGRRAAGGGGGDPFFGPNHLNKHLEIFLRPRSVGLFFGGGRLFYMMNQ